MKKILAILISLFSFSCFASADEAPAFSLASVTCTQAKAAACATALPPSNPGFCASFKSVATCYCIQAGLPAGMCQDINVIYKRMISAYGSIEAACRRQVDPQTCIDDWYCYRQGGHDFQGNLCSATGYACQ